MKRFLIAIFIGLLFCLVGLLFFVPPSSYAFLGGGIMLFAIIILTEPQTKYYFEDGELALETTAPFFQVGPVKFDHNAALQHTLITGATGAGKTISAFLPIIDSFLKNHRRGGGLIVDQKGHLWKTILDITTKHGRENDLIVVKVRRASEEPLDHTHHRYNLVSDRSLPWTSHAKTIEDTVTAMRGKNAQEQGFFKDKARAHIAYGLEMLDQLNRPVNLRSLNDTLTNMTLLKAATDALAEMSPTPERNAIISNFDALLSNPNSPQTQGEIGTISTWLQNFLLPAIAEIFCSELPNTFDFTDLDKGKFICLSIPQDFDVERKAIATIFKIQTYRHGLRRFDQFQSHKELMLLPRIGVFIDEAQEILTVADDGTGDISATNRLRECGVFCVFATLSASSLLPHLGKDRLAALMNNFLNRIAFKAVDEFCATQTAQRVTKTLKKRKSTTVGQGLFAASRTFQEEVNFILRPDEIQGLEAFQAVIVKAGWKKGRYWRGKLKPIKI